MRRFLPFDNQGLSLIELLVGLAIMGILATATQLGWSRYRVQAEALEVIAARQTIRLAIMEFEMAGGVIPNWSDHYGNVPVELQSYLPNVDFDMDNGVKLSIVTASDDADIVAKGTPYLKLRSTSPHSLDIMQHIENQQRHSGFAFTDHRDAKWPIF